MLPPDDVMKREFGTKKERFKPASESGTLSPVGAFGPPDLPKQEEAPEEEARQEEKPSFADPDRIQAAYGGEYAYKPQLEEPYDDDFPAQTTRVEDHYEDDQTDESQEEYGFAPPPPWKGVGEMPMPPSFRQEGGVFLRDEPLFEGGPMRSEVNSWKKQYEEDGHGVFLTEHGDEIFIWRSLSRAEYREVMALPNTDPLQREEIFCEICVLWPYNYNFSSMTNRKAGVPAVISEQIMHESGFKKPSAPVRL